MSAGMRKKKPSGKTCFVQGKSITGRRKKLLKNYVWSERDIVWSRDLNLKVGSRKIHIGRHIRKALKCGLGGEYNI